MGSALHDPVAGQSAVTCSFKARLIIVTSSTSLVPVDIEVDITPEVTQLVCGVSRGTVYTCCFRISNYTLFPLGKPRYPLILNGERGFLRVNRLQLSFRELYKQRPQHAIPSRIDMDHGHTRPSPILDSPSPSTHTHAHICERARMLKHSRLSIQKYKAMISTEASHDVFLAQRFHEV